MKQLAPRLAHLFTLSPAINLWARKPKSKTHSMSRKMFKCHLFGGWTLFIIIDRLVKIFNSLKRGQIANMISSGIIQPDESLFKKLH